jgi:DNA-binding transcriptional ArsR family regulator
MQKQTVKRADGPPLPCCGPVPRLPVKAFGRQRATHLAEVLRALAHPLRLDIIAMLADSERNVGSLAEQLKVKPAIVSQQLRILRSNRLVSVSREKGLARYSLALPQLRRLVCCLSGCPYLP